MKYFFISLGAILMFLPSFSQDVQLPQYNEGCYRSDIVFTEIGNSPFGEGCYIGFSNDHPVQVPSGMEFKMVVYAIDQGGSPQHTAFKEIDGEQVEIHVGDVLDLPITFHVHSGGISFHIVIRGTPQTENEVYSCDLSYTQTLGDNYEVYFFNESPDGCLVGGENEEACVQNAKNSRSLKNVKVSPNPFQLETVIDLQGYHGQPYDFYLYDNQGNLLRFSENNTAEKLNVKKENLLPGIYYYLLSSGGNILHQGKLVLE